VVGDALALGDADLGSPAMKALEAVTALTPDSPEGILAGLISAASTARRDRDECLRTRVATLDVDTLMWIATAAMPPAVEPTDPLPTVCLDRLVGLDTAQGACGRAMLRGEPFVAPG
jgi:hypothetical protein